MRTARKRAGKGKRKIATVMREYKRGTLKSGSGRKSTSRQAGRRHRHERGPPGEPQAQQAALIQIMRKEKREQLLRLGSRAAGLRGVAAVLLCLGVSCAKPRSQIEIPEPPQAN